MWSYADWLCLAAFIWKQRKVQSSTSKSRPLTVCYASCSSWNKDISSLKVGCTWREKIISEIKNNGFIVCTWPDPKGQSIENPVLQKCTKRLWKKVVLCIFSNKYLNINIWTGAFTSDCSSTPFNFRASKGLSDTNTNEMEQNTILLESYLCSVCHQRLHLFSF